MAGQADQLGFANYRKGGIERIGDAALLLRAEQFAGAIYLAGRAVEAILRALLWKSDPGFQTGARTLDAGHDLRELLARVRDLGLLARETDRDDLNSRVQRVARLWYNNLRFAPSKFVETRWLGFGEFGKRRPHPTFKAAATAFFNDCSAIIKRCEVLCENMN